MNRFSLLITLAILVAACSPAATQAPEDSIVLPPQVDQPTATLQTTEPPANAKLPATSFESETYVNEEFGFALDYPAGWVVNESILGDRGSQVQFISAPELAEVGVLPEGASRVTAVIYNWDPKNDLPAYIANWKTAWESSGFTIMEEIPLVLELGLNAAQFTIKTPDSTAIVLVTALGDRYLVLTGEGNLELAREIVTRVRPISP